MFVVSKESGYFLHFGVVYFSPHCCCWRRGVYIYSSFVRASLRLTADVGVVGS